MTALDSDIYPQSTGSQAHCRRPRPVGIRFVALLTGAIAQRFLNPDAPLVPAEAAAQGTESPGSVL